MCKQHCVTNQEPMSKYRKKKQQENPNVYVGEWSPTKVCKTCGIRKDVLSEYTLLSNKRKGGRTNKYRSAECRQCGNAYSTQRRENDLAYRARGLVRGTKQRAKQKGIDHNLTEDWLLERLERGVCEVTGIPFTFTSGEIKGGHRSFTPSLDRTDTTKGYTKDNVKVVVWVYNGAKGVGTHEDVMKLARALTNV